MFATNSHNSMAFQNLSTELGVYYALKLSAEITSTAAEERESWFNLARLLATPAAKS